MAQDKKQPGRMRAPRYPEGLGGYLYGHRLNLSALNALEDIVRSGGENTQVVAACKALITETEKMKKSSVEVMQAYEKQLLILAEHIVEHFLPDLAKSIRDYFNELRNTVAQKIKEEAGDLPEADYEFMKIWQENLDLFIRRVSLKRFELLFANSLLNNDETREAFGFSKDLLTSFIRDRGKGKAELREIARIRAAQKRNKAQRKL